MAQATLKQAELNLSWTTVTAPVAGWQPRGEIENNLISTADSLLTNVQQVNPAWVRFSLGEAIWPVPARRVTAEAVQAVELVLPDGSVYPSAAS